jgi:hypothetical protein
MKAQFRAGQGVDLEDGVLPYYFDRPEDEIPAECNPKKQGQCIVQHVGMRGAGELWIAVLSTLCYWRAGTAAKAQRERAGAGEGQARWHIRPPSANGGVRGIAAPRSAVLSHWPTRC